MEVQLKEITLVMFGDPDTIHSLPAMYSHTLTHQAHLSHAAHHDNYLPQVLVHRDTPHMSLHGATRQGEQTAAIQGSARRKRGVGLIMLCVCVGSGV